MYEENITGLIYEFEKFNIKTHAPNQNSCGMWFNEREVLLWAALNSPQTSSNWVEIGSNHGGSSVLLCLASNLLPHQPILHTVDIEYGQFFDQNISNGGFWNKVRKICGTSRTFKECYSKPISFAFIDGFHSFKWVVEDFENIKDNLVDGAYIAFHDCSPHIIKENNISYKEACLKSAQENYSKWMEDQSHNFLVDEAICYLQNKYRLEHVLVPIRKYEFYPKETGLSKWEKGTTSPYNSLEILIYRKLP